MTKTIKTSKVAQGKLQPRKLVRYNNLQTPNTPDLPDDKYFRTTMAKSIFQNPTSAPNQKVISAKPSFCLATSADLQIYRYRNVLSTMPWSGTASQTHLCQFTSTLIKITGNSGNAFFNQQMFENFSTKLGEHKFLHLVGRTVFSLCATFFFAFHDPKRTKNIIRTEIRTQFKNQ